MAKPKVGLKGAVIVVALVIAGECAEFAQFGNHHKLF